VLAADPLRYAEDKIMRRASRIVEFINCYPQIFPDNLASSEFHSRFLRDVPWLINKDTAIKQYLYSNADFIALCHWNANVDNAWFWRTEAGELQCGLMDWGRVNQMNIALALWGCLSAAEIELWDNHIDELLALFVAQFRGVGGPMIEVVELKQDLFFFAATMGLAWLMDAPPLIRAQIPDLGEAESRFDPRFESNETARTQLHMLTNFLNLWETQDFGRILDHFLGRQQA